jgi:hypothetical protein
MILEYGVSNFLSFKEGGVVSFRLDGHVPESVSGGLNYATVFCVKGANASGKTHLLKGLSFLASFIPDSFSAYEVDEEIYISPFGDSEEYSSFYVEFSISGVEYRYELDAHPDRVVRETLYRKKKRKTKLFERIGDVVVETTKEFEWAKELKYRKNASVISTAHQHQEKSIEDIYKCFDLVTTNVYSEGHDDKHFGALDKVSKFIFENPAAKNVVEHFLLNCDTGVSSIKILEQEIGVKKGKLHIPYFLHETEHGEIWVPLHNESKGTIQLYRQCIAFMMVIENGSILIMDELDLYLHPDIVTKILNYFIDFETNKKGAQLLFTSHQNDVMDICGKYRTALVAKEKNISYTYRLDEIPGDMLRNDRPISPFYKSGKLGGVPKL